MLNRKFVASFSVLSVLFLCVPGISMGSPSAVSIEDQADSLSPSPDYDYSTQQKSPDDTLKDDKKAPPPPVQTAPDIVSPNAGDPGADRLDPLPDYLRGPKKKKASDDGSERLHIDVFGTVVPTFFNGYGISDSPGYDAMLSSKGYPQTLAGNVQSGLGGGVSLNYGNDFFTFRTMIQGDWYGGSGAYSGLGLASFPVTVGGLFTLDRESWGSLYAGADVGFAEEDLDGASGSFVADAAIGARLNNHVFIEIRPEWMSNMIPGVPSESGAFLLPVSVGYEF